MTREHTMGRRMAGLALTMLFGVATAAVAATDADLTREVEKRLADEEVVGFNVTVETEGAEVTLTGEVPSLWHREWAMEEARKTDGVTSVISYLTIRDAESLPDMARNVSRAITRYGYYTVFDYVTAELRDSIVTLRGVVTHTPDKPADLREQVSKVPGVKGVVVDLEVLTPSSGDWQIRRRLARNIYGVASFERYLGIDPGIHIIVRNGHVTLRGAVLTHGDRLQVESAARRTFGVIKVHNELKTKEDLEKERKMREKNGQATAVAN